LLILFGKLVEQMGNTHEGIASLEEAGQFATRVQFFLKLILQKSLLFLMSETLSA
jgi:hypothetical protein